MTVTLYEAGFAQLFAVKVKYINNTNRQTGCADQYFVRISVPLFAGLLIPATAARAQLKTVPGVPLVGLYENRVLLQIAGGFRRLVSTGTGFTTTTTL